ncbi:flagellar type III secretion system pore protein FliP [Novosphingobium lindaniclasticum]|uniref:Flagellar biosynthetic protein FliP n=1 Tax=Novosphingobium lindaniclasticum LE124 TaxID=1096930 RepID=T0I1F5_9SPHN|nr:flagellar type III secretion system pore protein FliP [Novosphingobium lindaniclasticum]EQB18148.1 flagellar biosynthesis protein FliP [Novosphingobium lindaniclasticum LE124]
MRKSYAVAAALCGATVLAFLPEAAMAQKVAGALGEGALSGPMSGRVIQLVLLMTVLSLAPGILMTITSFTRIIVALSLLRSGLGVQGVPPNPVVISLALFLSFFVMAPTFDAAWKDGMVPYNQGRINETQALERASKPFHTFMLKQVREDDVKLFVQLSGKVPASRAELPMTTLMPAFMISELRRAFEIGFLLLLPFLVIDLAVAAVLMAMGMMMLPPATISLPMKIIFFVLVDGWALIAGSLVKSFGVPG